jgi:hypothetical protein
MNVLLEPLNENGIGELRCPSSLELLGHWFEVDDVRYFAKL